MLAVSHEYLLRTCLKSNAGNPGLNEEAGIEDSIGLLEAASGRSVCRFRFLTAVLFTLQAVRTAGGGGGVSGCEGQNCEDASESVAQKAVEKRHGFALKHFNQFTKQAADRKARRGEGMIPFVGLTDRIVAVFLKEHGCPKTVLGVDVALESCTAFKDHKITVILEET
ncbi:hypothetical protein chiPu_0006742 [Chiloscyllium punctatum]|uniref:Uncharacterized protein n=1 Tax=Chiloscyllium punctatum TaxID=137246 RepID=A0A401SD79_CHIPU|nr:hypothetical protein [Chiloscyllium punctatum]